MDSFSGLRVLIVEDEGNIAFLIEDILESLGCEIVASVAALTRAIEVASTTTFDLAVLDVNLRGEPVFPLARTLRERGIPFIFCTGYGEMGMSSDFTTSVVVTKPFTDTELQQAIILTLESAGLGISTAGPRLPPRCQDS